MKLGKRLTDGSVKGDDPPMTGFKIAYAMLSRDGSRAGFSGVSWGHRHVYRAIDNAVCAHGSRHCSPSAWCSCGFHCFHDLEAARELAHEPAHRDAVLLHVAASGFYRRYANGLRYSWQRVQSVGLGRCLCDSRARVLDLDQIGQRWRRLLPRCSACAATRSAIAPQAFGRLLGCNVDVAEDDGLVGRHPVAPGAMRARSGDRVAAERAVASKPAGAV
jgi:hypothetical protein